MLGHEGYDAFRERPGVPVTSWLVPIASRGWIYWRTAEVYPVVVVTSSVAYQS